MVSFPAQVQHLSWDKERFPVEEDKLGRAIFSLVAEKSFLGPLPLEAWIFSGDSLQIVRFAQGKIAYQHMAALAALPNVQYLALVGGLKKQNQKSIAQVFLEAPNGQWWFGSQGLNQEGQVWLMDPSIERAIDWMPKPFGLGGWFSTARRLGIKVEFRNNQIQ